MQGFFLSFYIMLHSLLAPNRVKDIGLNCSFSNSHLTCAAGLGFTCCEGKKGDGDDDDGWCP